MLLAVIAGYDTKDSTSHDTPVPDYVPGLEGDIKGLRIGVPVNYFEDRLDPETDATLKSAIKQMTDLGAEINELNLIDPEYAAYAFGVLASAEASSNLARYDGVRFGVRAENADDVADMYTKTRSAGLGSTVKSAILLGTLLLTSGYYDEYYLRAQKVRTLIKDDFKKAFEKCDVIMAPVTKSTSRQKMGGQNTIMQMILDSTYTAPASLAGICSITLPCAGSATGLPVGMQLMGRAFDEETILKVAFNYEKANA